MTFRSRIGRVVDVFLLTLFILGGVGGLVAFGVAAWHLIPSHAVAVLAIVVMIPLCVWGLTQED